MLVNIKKKASAKLTHCRFTSFYIFFTKLAKKVFLKKHKHVFMAHCTHLKVPVVTHLPT